MKAMPVPLQIADVAGNAEVAEGGIGRRGWEIGHLVR